MNLNYNPWKIKFSSSLSLSLSLSLYIYIYIYIYTHVCMWGGGGGGGRELQISFSVFREGGSNHASGLPVIVILCCNLLLMIRDVMSSAAGLTC